MDTDADAKHNHRDQSNSDHGPAAGNPYLQGLFPQRAEPAIHEIIPDRVQLFEYRFHSALDVSIAIAFNTTDQAVVVVQDRDMNQVMVTEALLNLIVV